MVKELGRTTTLKGQSGKEYVFSLYLFDSFEDLKSAWENFPALYLFTQRYSSNGAYYHNYIYLGETGDLSTRFDSHHKEQCIIKHQSNCIGIYKNVPQDETKRKEVEKDILMANDFPCNEQNN